ncbi:MAG: efflux transporter outer membrane subunit [Desulfobulbus sp.]|jgi:multidrug efflux system outer membrane protein
MRSGHRTLVAAALLALMAGGCTLAPDYRRPDAPVPDRLPHTGAASSEEAKAAGKQAVIDASLGWRDFFADPQLQRLIQQALDNNRDLRASILTVEQYQALYRIQRSELFPEIHGTGSGLKQRTMVGEDVYGTTEAYAASVGITAYELDLFGRVRSLKEEALERYLAMEETCRSARISLVAQVAGAYLSWLTDRELLAVTEDTLRVEQELHGLIEQRVQEGLTNEIVLAQARTSLETARANLVRYQRLVAQDINNLILLIGGPLPHAAAQTALSDQLKLSAAPADLSSAILLQRPDIMAAEHALKGANARIGAARAAFFPSIRLTAAAGKMSSDLSSLFDSGTGTWLFSPSINLPIFTGGRLSAELDVAEVSRDLHVALYEKAIQSAFREAADALTANETYDRQLVAQQANLEANQRYYALARERYNEGLDSFLPVLDAQRSLYAARQGYLNVRLGQLMSRINLYKALGGGWKERT